MSPLHFLILFLLLSLPITCFSESVSAEDADIPKPIEKPDVMSSEYRAFWNDQIQSEIDARIEKFRKADATVVLTNVKPGSEVQIEQIGHEFLFGAHIFNFDQLGSDDLNAKYKELYGTLFNSATIAFYWKTFEPEPGKTRFQGAYEDSAEFWNQQSDPKSQPHWRRPATDPVVAFCESKGIQMNGHTIIWGNRKWQHPDWLPKDPDQIAEMEKLFEKRIKELAEYYQGRLNRWDVVNESATDYRLQKTGKLEQNDAFHQNSSYGLMPADYAFQAFQTAKAAFPETVQFNINEYAVDDFYADQVQNLIDRGCRIDLVGVQMHLFNPQETLDIAAGKNIQTPEIQKKRLSAADQTGKPLHLSEITITAPNDNEKGRAIQAEVARNLYRYWFSWPSMIGITWWNVVDDCGAPGEPSTSGLFTRQMEPKPSFFALNQLINEEWKTRLSFQAESDSVEYRFRGFKGTYRIRWINRDGTEKSMEMIVH
ncbi:MAG: endo-1,4-beta-xylanase [Planctomycetia bacterium]|nr:endo-1,4-beta-xylanase [Planctomycetia bacterium]